jgi:hypothetical protein
MLDEKEILDPVDLCDGEGGLNPGAVGWSRRPLQRCRLRGHPLRKKKWHYWMVTGPEHLFSVTVASVDYLSLAVIYTLEYGSGELFRDEQVRVLSDGGVSYPDGVYGDVLLESRRYRISIRHAPDGVRMEVDGRARFRGPRISAELDIAVPAGHDTLNVAVPWSRRRFQFTSKQTCLPARGNVRVGRREYRYAPEDSFACLDFGRGVWPYRTAWNWASCSCLAQGRTVGLNFGARWTDGTGMTENGVVVDGRLEKLGEQVEFLYDPKRFLDPWRLRTEETRRVDLEFRPFYDLQSSLNLGLLKTGVHQVFGRYSGRIRHEGTEVEIRDAVGWAEEHLARW